MAMARRNILRGMWTGISAAIMSFFCLMAAQACHPSGIVTVDNTGFAEAISDTSSVILIDVRTPEEFNAGHIPGAVNIDVQSPDFRDKILGLDNKKTAAVYCRSGVRSLKAASILSSEGFRVLNLKDGFLGWDGPAVRP